MRAVVIGGGITGTLTGLALQRAGWRVTLLEQAHLGAGSSSRTAAGIRQQFTSAATVRGMRYATAWYGDWAATLPAGQRAIVPQGYLFLAETAAGWAETQARVAAQRALGLHDVEALDADSLRRAFPWLAEDRFTGGSFCPSDGFLHPNVVYAEAANQLVEAGGVLRLRAPVVAAEHHADGRLRAVATPEASFEADVFVDASNAWSPRLGALLGATALPIDPLRRVLWFLARDADAMDAATLRSMPLVVTPSGTYLRPENDDSVLLGHAHDAMPEPAFTMEDQDLVPPELYHAGQADGLAITAWMHAADAIPALGAFAGLTATTAGYYATTPDHVPFLDRDPQIDNLIRLVGFSGHGAMFGPFSAAVAASLAASVGGPRPASLALPTGEVGLEEFRIGRAFDAKERLVI